jgi:hypothetical protein
MTLLPARLALPCLTASILLVTAGSLRAESLSERIDSLVRAVKDYDKVAAPRADDAEFARRVYLDLTGVIPTAAELSAFSADQAAHKRKALVERLLGSEAYAWHMQQVFDVLLMDRRPAKHVKAPEWQEFLRGAFAANKPYDELVREILAADGTDPKTRALARFYLDREAEPHAITRDLSRLFLGMNLTCAQCHDHPLVDAYKQDYYYGLYAFLSRTYLFTDKAAKQSVIAEKGEGDTTYQSVFKAKVTKTSGPRMPDARELPEPKFEKGQEYLAPVKQGERGIPKHSRRAQLAAAITGPDNPRFARATVNRLWSHYLGRGIVHPVEYDHPANPPSHPTLLDLLAEEFQKSKFDLKAMIGAIVLSETYQRSSAVAADAKEPDAKLFAAAALRPLSPEQLARSILRATGQEAVERKALGAKAAEGAVFARMSAQAGQLQQLFATAPGEPASGQDFEATLDQTLFLNNSKQLLDLLTPRPGNLADRLGTLKDAGPLADELYLNVLSRPPSADERRDVDEYLRPRSADRQLAVQELVWALLTSAEFRFNH